MSDLVTWLEGAIQSYGWGGLLIGTLLEEIIIPLPSSLIMMGAGFFLIQADSFWAALGQVAFPFVPIGLVGVMAGSLVWYGLAFWLEELTVKRIGKYVGISWEEVKGIEQYFKARAADEWVLFALRAIPVFPGALTAILMGLIRMPWRKFVVFGGLGTAVRLMIMGLLGWLFQGMYAEYVPAFERAGTIATVCMAIAVAAAYFVVKKQIQAMVRRLSP